MKYLIAAAFAATALTLGACSNSTTPNSGLNTCVFTGTAAQELFNNQGTITANGGTGTPVTSYQNYSSVPCQPGYTAH
jgi:hypothetical protein